MNKWAATLHLRYMACEEPESGMSEIASDAIERLEKLEAEADQLAYSLREVIRLELGENYAGSTPEQIEAMERARRLLARNALPKAKA